jgi:hypothetical protein
MSGEQAMRERWISFLVASILNEMIIVRGLKRSPCSFKHTSFVADTLRLAFSSLLRVSAAQSLP